VAGKIELDMTFLRTEGHIRPVKPDNDGQGEHVLAEKQINIAAAFASLESEDESEEDEEEYLTD
jgi:hypothetical protein